MDTWDSEWQERQQQMDEHVGKYAAELEIEREAVEQAVSIAFDLAWDAAKPVIDECAKSMAKAIIAELAEAPPDALAMAANSFISMVATRLGVEVDDELLTEADAGSTPWYLADAVSNAVYDAVFKALGGNE